MNSRLVDDPTTHEQLRSDLSLAGRDNSMVYDVEAGLERFHAKHNQEPTHEAGETVKVTMYGDWSATKVAVGAWLSLAMIIGSLLTMPALLFPLATMLVAAVVVGLLYEQIVALQSKLDNERKKHGKLRGACKQVLAAHPEGMIANFLAAALVDGPLERSTKD